MFCEIVAGIGPSGLLAYEDDTERVFAARDQRERNLGPMLSVGITAAMSTTSPPSLYPPLMDSVRRVAEAVHQAFGATGTTVQRNNAPPGQDDVDFHVHVIPPHPGDTGQEGLPSGPYPVVEPARIAQAEAVRVALGAAGRFRPKRPTP